MTDILIIAGPSIALILIMILVFIEGTRRERQARRDWIAGKRR